jgi:hypothetical protein
MSAAKQFKTGVSERSGPEDWRGGLERSHARRMRREQFIALRAREGTRASSRPGAKTDWELVLGSRQVLLAL